MLGDATISSSQPTPASSPQGQTQTTTQNTPSSGSAEAMVKLWTQRITKAKEKWKADFDRMRENMDFVAGLQWPGQYKIRSEKYIVNMTLRAVNQGVASLYAKDPKVSAKRRDRLDFKLWDGKQETILQAMQIQQMAAMHGLPMPPDVMAMLNDYQQGKMRHSVIDGIGKTLEVVCQYQMDSQQPSFKTQMKQLVRRVNVCGVGYIKVKFERDYEPGLTQSETRMSVMDRAKMARAIIEKMEKGEITEDSAEVQQLKSLVESLGVSQLDYEGVEVKERLVFDFPQATSIIPDPACRALKGFVGAKWVVEEFYYPLEFVNAFFEKDIQIGGELKTFQNGKMDESNLSTNQSVEDKSSVKIRLWEVTNLEDKSRFMICDGYCEFVVAPELLDPVTKGFWQIVPVTFNDIEVEDGCKATIFPPSSVDLIYSSQVQWNQVRHRLANHRKANAPKFVFAEGTLSEEDLDRLAEAEDQAFVGLKSVPPGTDPAKVIMALQVPDIKPELYDTKPISEDVLLSTGQQEANMGPAQPDVTATVGTIAEQSRMSVAASDVDGLDDSLSDVFRCGGEMLLREMSSDVVKQIAGIGAIWPDLNKEEFINEISLEVVAASSGRPNKAIDVANWQRIAPLLQAAGANPQAIIRESVKRLDDRLDPTEFFPLPVPMMNAAPTDQSGQPSPVGGGPKTPNPRQQPQGGQAAPSPSGGVGMVPPTGQ